MSRGNYNLFINIKLQNVQKSVNRLSLCGDSTIWDKIKMDDKFIRYIKNSIKTFELDLNELSLFVPVLPIHTSIFPVMASLAGAKQVFAVTDDLETVNRTAMYQQRYDWKTEVNFISELNQQMLSQLDIIVKSDDTSYLDRKSINFLKKECVISYFPQNCDFSFVSGIDTESCAEKGIKIILLNPNCKEIGLFKHISHLILKRCYENGISLFKSKILLLGGGELTENILSLLKAAGANVFAASTTKPDDRDYALKHIADSDAIILCEYPLTSEIILGNTGFLNITEVKEKNPELKIIHLSGKIEMNPLILSGLDYYPDTIIQNSLNLNIRETGLKLVCDTTAAILKAAESLIKNPDKSIQFNDSVVSFRVVNPKGSL